MNDPNPNVKPKYVKAIYSFKPSNTDELCFQKGDILTVTQVMDEGWWEGMLDGVTGWFPSNYVQEVSGADVRPKKENDFVINHKLVLDSVLSSERAFVNDLDKLLNSSLRCLESSGILTPTEYASLCSNLDEIASLHRVLLVSIEGIVQQPISQQRIGNLLLQTAPKIKSCHEKYCISHPKAVAVLQSKKDELSSYMQNLGAPAPDIMALTTSLSQPFRRLERYPSLLQELDRHTEESHVDRGDTQRAIVVYRDISQYCMEIRRQKEMEYEILHSEIKGWEGEEISQLGEVLLLSHVRILTDNGERKERLLLHFPGLIVLLSVSPKASGYNYEGKLTTYSATVESIEDSDNLNYAFEIYDGAGTGEHLIVICTSSLEKNKWLQRLKQPVRLGPSTVVPKTPNPQSAVSFVTSTTMSFSSKPSPINSNTFSKSFSKMSISSLRPYPPLRPVILVKDDGIRSPRSARRLLGSSRRKPVDDAQVLQDDAIMLTVINAYCCTQKTRYTCNSLDLAKIRLTQAELQRELWDVMFENPPVLIAEEEKLIVEEMSNGNIEEKTLVDTVYSLRDQVKELKQEQLKLRKDLDNEKKARMKLESMLKRQSRRSLVEDSLDSMHETLTNT